MRKSIGSKLLVGIFLLGIIPASMTIQSCGSKGAKYNKSRNGGKRVSSSGKVGYRKSKNRHVWGK